MDANVSLNACSTVFAAGGKDLERQAGSLGLLDRLEHPRRIAPQKTSPAGSGTSPSTSSSRPRCGAARRRTSVVVNVPALRLYRVDHLGHVRGYAGQQARVLDAFQAVADQVEFPCLKRLSVSSP